MKCWAYRSFRRFSRFRVGMNFSGIDSGFFFRFRSNICRVGGMDGRVYVLSFCVFSFLIFMSFRVLF